VTDQQQEERPDGRPSERPGGYQRSIAGAIGSMIVLVLVVLAFVVFRGAFRDNDEVDVEPVDYLAVVGPAQEAGVPVVYPPSLPDGWTPTSVSFVPGDRPAWGVGMLSDDGKFVGVRQADEDLDTLLDTYVDPDAVEGETITVDGALVPEWQEWSDAGGDHAYSASIQDYEVIVFGSAPTDDLLTVVRSLTDEPVGD
jgi:hypothetical protein